LLALALGCSLRSELSLDSAQVGDGGPGGVVGAAQSASENPATDGGSDEFAFFRVANFSEQPALDFCIRPHDPTDSLPFETSLDSGPYFASRHIETGLPYPLSSFYIARPPNRYDLRFVAPGSTDCSTKSLGVPDVLDLPSLGPGTHWSFVVTGCSSDFAVRPYEDEIIWDGSIISLRFINVMTGASPLDFGFGAGDSFAAFFNGIGYGQCGSGPGIDALGYRHIGSVHDAATIRASESSADLLSGQVQIDFGLAGHSASFFAVGTLGTPRAKLIHCHDFGSIASPFAACNAVQ
jgi:hypothetical protein